MSARKVDWLGTLNQAVVNATERWQAAKSKADKKARRADVIAADETRDAMTDLIEAAQPFATISTHVKASDVKRLRAILAKVSP